MSYQALLFSADERASGVVKQVLGELEFHVEVCNEPFAAVKQITNQRYDALVVDCDNEQNATLLFKSARNSNSNKDSLAVGLVQGQGSIAKAFRIGANLVLTKPIHAEQSKATLRTARGLLRKAEAAKSTAAATASTAGSEEATLNAVAAFSALPELSVGPVATASLEQQAEEFPKLGPAEAALLESMPTPVSRQLSERSAVSQESKGQASVGMASALISAHATAGGAAAVAPAKIPVPASTETIKKDKPSSAAKEISAPLDKRIASESKPSGQAGFAESAIQSNSLKADLLAAANPAEEIPSKKNFLIALVLVLGSAGAIYYSWPQLQPLLLNIPTIQKYLGSQPAPPASSLAPRPATPVRPAAGAQSPTGGPAETSSGSMSSPAQSGQAASNQAATNQAAANVAGSSAKSSGNTPDGGSAAPVRLDAQTAAGLLPDDLAEDLDVCSGLVRCSLVRSSLT